MTIALFSVTKRRVLYLGEFFDLDLGAAVSQTTRQDNLPYRYRTVLYGLSIIELYVI